MTSDGEKLFPFIVKQFNEYGEIKEFLKNNENNDSMLDWELRVSFPYLKLMNLTKLLVSKNIF